MQWPKAERVLIVASGPSVKAADPTRIAATSATIIAVNGAIDWLPRADYWFTLDDSDANMRRVENRRPGTTYVMAARDYRRTPAEVIRVRRLPREGVDPALRLHPEMRGRPGLSGDPTAIHSGNSAYGALGLAYHMRPSIIGMLGVDGTQEPRVEGGVPNDLRHLAGLFATAVPQLAEAAITVANGSLNSMVTCFPRMAPDTALSLLEGVPA